MRVVYLISTVQKLYTIELAQFSGQWEYAKLWQIFHRNRPQNAANTVSGLSKKKTDSPRRLGPSVLDEQNRTIIAGYATGIVKHGFVITIKI